MFEPLNFKKQLLTQHRKKPGCCVLTDGQLLNVLSFGKSSIYSIPPTQETITVTICPGRRND